MIDRQSCLSHLRNKSLDVQNKWVVAQTGKKMADRPKSLRNRVGVDLGLWASTGQPSNNIHFIDFQITIRAPSRMGSNFHIGWSVLPCAGDGIGIEGGVFGDDAYASLDVLGDEEAVERIAVMELQGFHSGAVRGLQVDSNNAEALEFAREEDVPIVHVFEIEAFGGTLEGDLPETRRGVVDGQVAVDDAARGGFEPPVAVEHPKERVGVEQPATDG